MLQSMHWFFWRVDCSGSVFWSPIRWNKMYRLTPGRRRRVLEIPAGARFFSTFPLSSLLFRPLGLSHPLTSLPSFSCLSPSPMLSFPLPLSLPSPLKSIMRSGESCNVSLRVRVEPVTKLILLHFQAEIRTTFVSDIMTHNRKGRRGGGRDLAHPKILEWRPYDLCYLWHA